MTTRINIGKDFSLVPSGRTEEDGPDSGERFRERFLVPNLAAGHHLEILLDDAVGYQSSFLEEAFGPLTGRLRIAPADLSKRITIVSTKPKFKVFKQLIERFLEGRPS